MLYLLDRTVYYSKKHNRRVNFIHKGNTDNLFERTRVYIYVMEDITYASFYLNDDAFIKGLELEDIMDNSEHLSSPCQS